MSRPDAFTRKHDAYWNAVRKAKTVTVPDPLSPDCEIRKHTACSGDAWDKLRDQAADCTCACHRSRR